MKQSMKMCSAQWGALACVLMIAQSASAQDASGTKAAPVAGARPALTTLEGQAAHTPGSTTQGNVAQLTQLIRDGQLNELRTTYNGTYGASLLLYAPDVTYYVALFQDKHFWRVFLTQDLARAESVYASFVQQTVQLSDIEIRTTELQAQNTFLDRVIALQNEQAKRLQADLAIAHNQREQVLEQQRQARGQAAVLQAEKNLAQAKLRELQRQVEQLQRQNESDLRGSALTSIAGDVMRESSRSPAGETGGSAEREARERAALPLNA